MRKIVVMVSMLAALVAGPGLVGSAEARHRHDRYCGHGFHDGGYGYHGGYGGSAWDVVQSDPCRAAEYARYARKHKNPNKRARKVEKLAREGCSDRYDYRYAGEPYGYGGYGYDPYHQPYATDPYYGGYRYGYGAPSTAEAVVLPLLHLFLNR